MNAIRPSRQYSAANILARAASLPDGLADPHGARAHAQAALSAHGLPNMRDERFKFTNLRGLSELTLARPTGAQPAPAYAALGDHPVVILSEGRARVLGKLPDGARLDHDAAMPPALGVLAQINACLSEATHRLAIDAGVDAGRLVIVHAAPAAADSAAAETEVPSQHDALGIHLEDGARLEVIELFAGQGRYVSNPRLDVALRPSARLRHIRVQRDGRDALHLARIDAAIASDAEYALLHLGRGAALSRLEVQADLLGAGAQAAITAAIALGGQQHSDLTTVIRHVAPSTSSRETVRHVLDGRAHGVFQGRIEVAREAQKTDGYQMNQTLLLSDTAAIDSKPELEIFADDVKCSHGATVGALDDEHVFYLRSRGIPEADARAMLIDAFLGELLDDIGDETLRDALRALFTEELAA